MNKQQTCNPEWIELFLEQQMSHEEQTDFELHLDSCDRCRRQLETSAASEEIWTGVRESVPFTEELDRQSSGDLTSEDEHWSSHKTVLQMLAPTDNDRMMGRLGTYEVGGVIGSGGMGVVLKAFDASLNRYVAIKVLAPHLSNCGSARKRFSREAQAAAAVVHENVIEIHAVADTGGLSYLVMPYVRGPSLQRRLDQEGPLALAEILRIGMQTADGLSAAHAQGLVHRDVKPANILLADGVERVKLTDFGLARAADDASLTKTGTIAGTPQYMSPEQACGESVDHRSDLFSLGSTMYAMCTGRAPFRAETSYGVLKRIADENPRPIREINPEIPDWLCDIISRLMSKQADDRFGSAREVANLLKDCLAHVQQPTVVPLPASLSTQSRFNSNSRRWLGVLGMFSLFAFGFLGMFLWSADPPDISGQWSGQDWGEIVLKQEKPGKYVGTYTDTSIDEHGTLQLRWSRIERRFNGGWSEGEDRFGKLSLRLVDKEIRGAWTTSKDAKINPATPALADLLWVRGTPQQARNAKSKKEMDSPTEAIFEETDESPTISYPYAVDFEQGPTAFIEGDDITILDVRGTSETFAPGDTYWIRGTYELASHEQAKLLASVTSHNNTSKYVNKVKIPTKGSQQMIIQRGTGTFTLILPMYYDGWPHVSFYPLPSGNGFGGNYFGTGESVMRKPLSWIDRANQKATTQATPPKSGEEKNSLGSVDSPSEAIAGKPDAPPTIEYPHVVQFEQGETRFKEGDNITIQEIRGTAETFAPDNIYWIKGTYELASADGATLAAYTTAKYEADGTSSTRRAQKTTVEQGKGTFTLLLPMSCEGWPHVSFYSKDDGNGFGGNYFGTGETVLKQMPWPKSPDQKSNLQTTPPIE